MASPEPETAVQCIGSPRPEFADVPWLNKTSAPDTVAVAVALESWERVEHSKKAEILYAFSIEKDGEKVHAFKESYRVLEDKHKRIQQIVGCEHTKDMKFPKPSMRDRMRDFVNNDDNVNQRGEDLRVYCNLLFSDPVLNKDPAFIEMFLSGGGEGASEAEDVARLELPDDNVGGVKGMAMLAKEFGSKLAHGANLQYLQIPPRFLSPASSLQKLEQLGRYVHLLFPAPAGDSDDMALERMLCALRYQITLLTDEPFGKKPYNPVLGETLSGTFTHPDAKGSTTMIAEQVLHHPAVSALCMHNKEEQVTVRGAMEAVPRFWGNTVEVQFHGERTIEMAAHGETYSTGSPSLCFRGILGMGRMFTEWQGDVVISCKENGLRCELNCIQKGFLGLRGENNGITGKVEKVSGETTAQLATFKGCWQGKVMVTKTGGSETLLMDREAEEAVEFELPPEELRVPTDSEVVWGALTKSLHDKDWGAARGHKNTVETAERAKRKVRVDAGEEFRAVMFEQTGEEAFAWAARDDVLTAKQDMLLASNYAE